MPGHANLALGAAGLKEPEQLRLAVLVETLMGGGEQPSTPIQRVIAVPAVPEGVVLHTAPHVIEAGVGQLDHVERVRDLDRAG
ncbi:hypothetical protein BH24ACT4_BH24ACT4_20650 [soil metagenome]